MLGLLLTLAGKVLSLPRAGGQPGSARAHPAVTRTVSLKLEPPSPEESSGPGGSHPSLDPAVPQKLPVPDPGNPCFASSHLETF